MALLDAVRRLYESTDQTAARAIAVPEVVAMKLTYLTELASGAFAAGRDIDEHLREAHDEQRTVEALLARARADAARHPFHPALRSGPPPEVRRDGGLVIERVLAGDHSLEVPALEARLALAVREVARLAPRATAARARAATAGLLAERCTAFVQQREPAVLAEAVARMRREAATIRLPDDSARLPAELTRTRTELVALDAERAALERAPVPVAEARARVLAAVDGITANWRFRLDHFFSPQFDPAASGSFGVLPEVNETDDAFRAFVVQFLGEKIKAALMAELEREAEHHGPALAADERGHRLAAVDRKARAATVREELLILALEEGGVETLRREDAEPEIVLALGPAAGAGTESAAGLEAVL